VAGCEATGPPWRPNASPLDSGWFGWSFIAPKLRGYLVSVNYAIDVLPFLGQFKRALSLKVLNFPRSSARIVGTPAIPPVGQGTLP
jgi:hypothetical protein